MDAFYNRVGKGAIVARAFIVCISGLIAFRAVCVGCANTKQAINGLLRASKI